MAEQSLEHQAKQNEIIGEQTRAATEATSDMIEAEGQARQEIIQLQRDLVESEAAAREELVAILQDFVERDADGRSELSELRQQAHAAYSKRTQEADRQRDLLEQERRQIAAERLRAPFVDAAVPFVDGLVICVLPLVVVIYLLRTLGNGNEPDLASLDVLVEELVAERPRLLASTRLPALPSVPSGEAKGSTPER